MKRYVLALVVTEQILDGEPNGNCCWIDSEQKEWALVDDFQTEDAASNASLQLSQKYHKQKNR